MLLRDDVEVRALCDIDAERIALCKKMLAEAGRGLFGELIHCEGGYQHDLRAIKFDPGAEFGEQGISESRWRTWHSVHRNGDFFTRPTVSGH